ncbi:DNA processing protein [Terribacillus aidingensis]|uniref:DNA processing protein n=1 Tax=Terribacillus aidingensis TaxID=586416 RepID=A0A285NJG2_9BACI|nr:DNA-processing protein DprA [Terribacillus aidingensis]SNZ09589.1 DNA processing protein [Terribacillus aidingensis]
MEKRERLLLLHRVLQGRRKLMRHILACDPQLDNLLLASSQELRLHYHLSETFAGKLFRALQDAFHRYAIEQAVQNFHTVTCFDADYPAVLQAIPDAPLVLYAAGKLELLDQMPAVSVVGSRQPTHAAPGKIAYLLEPLASAGWTIVSGMAKGIDSMAHHAALRVHGSTIAVLGSGLHHIYPLSNKKLFDTMAESQLLISEYYPDQPPRKHHFPERNRIISALGFCTVVVEAKKQSGSMHTVMHALEQGREVFAIPGDPLKAQTAGCHQMISEGAGIIFEPGQLLEEWEQNKTNWAHYNSRN